jgi:para-nitrobenzyl esterase
MGTCKSVCFALGISALMAAGEADPIKTSSGLVSGVAVADGAVRSYKGIPFAKAPVGDLRWRAPQPVRVSPTSSVRLACSATLSAAIRYSHECFTLRSTMSEDCLYLMSGRPRPPARNGR